MKVTESQPIPDDAPGGDLTFACQVCGKSITFPDERRGHVEICPHCYEYVDVPNRPGSQDLSALPATAEDDTSEPSGARLPSTRELWFEVVAVLCLGVIPGLYAAIEDISGWVPHHQTFVYHNLWRLISALQVSLPLLLIVKLTREPWARFGIVRFSWFLDLATGVMIWMCELFVHRAVISLLPGSLLTGTIHWAKPVGALDGFLLLVTCLAGVFAEEFVMRGYLLTRLERLLHSTGLAILVTTALFAGCHVYQGAAGLVGAAASGLVYGIAFCLQRRLWPICIAHAIWNLSILM